MEDKKKILLVFIVAIFLVLIVSATYAYFAVSTVNNFGTSTINAQAGNIGTVTLNGNSAQLNLSVTALDMVQGSNDITYYASSSGTTTTETEETIGTATLTPNTDTTTYHCTYTLSVTHTGTNDMYTAFSSAANKSTGQIILTINGTDYDFYDGWPTSNEVSGEFYIKGTQTKDITAGLRIVNDSDINQNYLAGSDISISISIKNNTFSCTAEEEPPSWIYYGWGTTNSDYNAARRGHLIFLRSQTTPKTSGITASDIVQVCGLVGTLQCIDYFVPSRGDGTSFGDGMLVDCDRSGNMANCFEYISDSYCRVNSNGTAGCY